MRGFEAQFADLFFSGTGKDFSGKFYGFLGAFNVKFAVAVRGFFLASFRKIFGSCVVN